MIHCGRIKSYSRNGLSHLLNTTENSNKLDKQTTEICEETKIIVQQFNIIFFIHINVHQFIH